jgi:uncharacterized protein (DUF3084 family)
MFPAANPNQNLEVRDASGTTVGFFVQDRSFREFLAERDALRQQVAALQEQLDAVRKDGAQVRLERDSSTV